MSLDVKARRRFIKHCDPLQPLKPGDPLYVDLDAEPSTRGEQSCVDRLRETIRLQDESCQLFSGFPGTGKTTELQRLAARVHQTHRLPNDDKEQLALFGFLFERWLILAYRNGDEWYDLHPLVLKALPA